MSEKLAQAPGAPVILDATPSSTSSVTDETKQGFEAEKGVGGSTLYDVSTVSPLAPRDDDAASAGQGLLVILGLKKRKRAQDLDAVSTSIQTAFTKLTGNRDRYPRKRFRRSSGLPLYTTSRVGELRCTSVCVSRNSAEFASFQHFKPSLRWSYREEQQATRRVDFRIFSWMMFMFLALNVSRYNLASATADNLLRDLKITQGYAYFSTAFYRLSDLLMMYPTVVNPTLTTSSGEYTAHQPSLTTETMTDKPRFQTTTSVSATAESVTID